MNAWALITSSSRRRARSGSSGTWPSALATSIRAACSRASWSKSRQSVARVSSATFECARLRRDVPELDLVLAHQRPRQRVLRGVVEHRQPWSARETQFAGLAQGRSVTHEAGGAKPRGLERDDPRDRQQAAGMSLELESLQRAGEQQNPERVLDRIRHHHRLRPGRLVLGVARVGSPGRDPGFAGRPAPGSAGGLDVGAAGCLARHAGHGRRLSTRHIVAGAERAE